MIGNGITNKIICPVITYNKSPKVQWPLFHIPIVTSIVVLQ